MALNFRQNTSRIRPYVVLAICLALSLAFVTGYSREGESGPLHSAQSMVSGAFGPAKIVSGAVSAAEAGALAGLSDFQAAPDTLTALKRQNAELREMVAQLEEYRQEAERLEGLVGLTDRYLATGVAARVVSRSSDTWNRMITLDAGTNSGVRAGYPVIGAAGLVGQVVSVGTSTCDARLLDDPQTGVAAMVQSSRAEGILRGSFDGLLYLEDVDSTVEVVAGDVVVTSGLGGGFYRGIMIGTVVKVDGVLGDNNRRIVVEPSAEALPLEEVFIVTGMASEGDAPAEAPEGSGEASVSDRGLDGDGVAADDSSAGDQDAQADDSADDGENEGDSSEDDEDEEGDE